MRLGYATNAFPGETLAELLDSVRGPLSRIAREVSDAGPLGVEVRLGAKTVEELSAEPQARERLVGELSEAGLEAISVNGFSPSDFHSRRVKEDAYRPTWLEPGRAEYTRKLAAIYAAMLPAGAVGSISTSAGSFKAFGHGEELLPILAEAYADMAGYLAGLEERTGRRILLSIEPEPGCTIESTDELIDFFEEYLPTAGARRLVRAGGRTTSEAEALLARHLAVTFDTAHLSVEFENLAESAHRITAAGIKIGKVHATSALRLDEPRRHPAVFVELSRLSRSPYMHQVVGVSPSGCVCYRSPDLAEMVSQPERARDCKELRIHFHLPLHLERFGVLGTTSAETLASVRDIVSRGLCETVILETYTWKVLALLPGVAEGGIEAAVVEELRWARGALLDGRAVSPPTQERDRAVDPRSL